MSWNKHTWPRIEAKVGSTEYGTEHAVSVDCWELTGWLINFCGTTRL